MASINNLQTVYADKIYLASSTGLNVKLVKLTLLRLMQIVLLLVQAEFLNQLLMLKWQLYKVRTYHITTHQIHTLR